MANNKAEYEAKNARVGEIIEGAITALQDVGLDHAGALHLLVIQSVIRMDDRAKARRLLTDILMKDLGGEFVS